MSDKREARDQDCIHHTRFRSYPDDNSASFCTMCEIERLRAEVQRLVGADIREATMQAQRDECRRLLREAVAKLDYPELANHWGGWVIATRAAAGGDP